MTPTKKNKKQPPAKAVNPQKLDRKRDYHHEAEVAQEMVTGVDLAMELLGTVCQRMTVNGPARSPKRKEYDVLREAITEAEDALAQLYVEASRTVYQLTVLDDAADREA